MIRVTLMVVLVLSAIPAFAQEATDKPTTTIDFRGGTWKHGEFYEITELVHTRGRLEPKIAVRLFSSPHDERDEKEVTLGFGFELFKGEKYVLSQDVLVSRAWTKTGETATYLQPVVRASVELHEKLWVELMGFPYVPLGHGDLQWVLERARATYKITSFLGLVGGMGATELPGSWSHTPLADIVVMPAGGKYGSLEVGYQGGLQIRYVVAMSRHHK